MKLATITTSSLIFKLTTGLIRQGLSITLTDEQGRQAQGEASPLPGWSLENLEQVIAQFETLKPQILQQEWSLSALFEEILKLNLSPSLAFALESALLGLLDPLPPFKSHESALLMGSEREILHQAALREKEGYVSAKLKVSNLPLHAAKSLINQLKRTFRLRIDVNRAWDTSQAISFFNEYPIDAFDYVEEPFADPRQLHCFIHPLAADESYPSPLNFQALEEIPSLKAIVYKPMIQGGIAHCLPLQKWALRNGIQVVLSSAFESEIGLHQINAMAKRLGISTPSGLGTRHFLQK